MNSVKTFIQLDETMLRQKTSYFPTNEDFIILKTLNSTKMFPSVIYWVDNTASSDLQKFEIINQFFNNYFIALMLLV